MDNKSKVNVAVIGCGSITKFRHAPEYAANPNVNIVGFFDPISQRAQDMADSFGGRVYDSYDEMLADNCIHAVSVCTSNSTHAEISIAALKSGKHVLCEKPMSTSVKDARLMVEASKESSRILMVGHNQRFVMAHIRAKEILKSGTLGEVISFRTIFSHAGPEVWSADKGKNTWFFKKNDAFVGVMGDLGVHKVDLIRYLLDDEIYEVSCVSQTLDKQNDKGNMIEVDDHIFCILKTKRGVTGSLMASWSNYGEEENSTVIYCKQGVLKICDHPEYALIVHQKNAEVAFYKTGNIQTNANQVKSGVIDAFVSSIVHGVTPPVTGEDGLMAVKIIFACMESSQNKKAVEIT